MDIIGGTVTSGVKRIIPLGNLNPPGHTYPTDHIYFEYTGSELPVYAPAGGKVLWIENTDKDDAIRIGVTDTMTYYLGHIEFNKTDGSFTRDYKVGDVITAGDQIAVTGSHEASSCVDLGVLNKNVGNAFINQKYPLTTLYGDKPLKYYTGTLQTTLYDLVKPPSLEGDTYSGGVTDGKFVFDQSGKLIGNWFVEGATALYEWTNQLAFAYDKFYTDKIRIAIGRDNATIGEFFSIPSGATKPEEVTTATGVVAYPLYNANNSSYGEASGDRIGLMMIRMLSDTQIQVEIFSDTTSPSLPFTSAAWYYCR